MHSAKAGIATPPKFHVGDKVCVTRKMVHSRKIQLEMEGIITIASMKATKPPTYTIKGARGEPVKGTFYERTRAAIELTGNLPYRTSTQEEENPSICQVERLQ